MGSFRYKCFSCMKEFESNRLFRAVADGGSCPRCGTLVTTTNLVGVRGGIEGLGERLRAVNPALGYNPHGNCMHCAVETAHALVTGADPQQVDGSIAQIENQGGAFEETFDDDEGDRAQQVWAWLQDAPAGAVYAVDADDHAYNFVVGPDGTPYLVDSNQQIFRALHAVDDLRATGHNGFNDDPYDYDYGNPDEVEDLEVYYWGQLHAHWSDLLAGRVVPPPLA